MKTEKRRDRIELKPDMKLPRRRRALVGPATLLALAAAIVVVVYGRPGNRSIATTDAGRTIYEANASGRLQRIDTPTIAQKTPKGLWKPQVALVWQYTAELRLDHRQKQRIEALDLSWQREKAALDEAIGRAVSEADAVKQEAQAYRSASVSRITAYLGDYSGLSHRYNVLRAGYWSEALAVLTPTQRAILEHVTDADRKGSAL